MRTVSRHEMLESCKNQIVNDDSLFELNFMRKKKKRRCRGGIYFLFLHKELLYIGKSSNGEARIWEHPDIPWDSYFFHRLPKNANLDNIEMAYIKKFQPKYNIVHNAERVKRNIKNKIERTVGYNVCNDCGTRFGVIDTSCPTCWGTNIQIYKKDGIRIIKNQHSDYDIISQPSVN